jgi:hypothetical protein
VLLLRYSSISVRPAHAARARTVAHHLGVPVSVFLETIIDQAYGAEIGERPQTVTIAGDKLAINIGDDRLDLPVACAASFADYLRQIAADGGAFINADDPAMVSISRQGCAVVIENMTGLRKTIGTTHARMLADEIEAAI